MGVAQGVQHVDGVEPVCGGDFGFGGHGFDGSNRGQRDEAVVFIGNLQVGQVFRTAEILPVLEVGT